MPLLLRLLGSDIMKTKRTPFLLIHLLIPLVGAGMFLAYYSFSAVNPINSVAGYLQVLSVTFPTLIGIVCSMVAEQEVSAGNYQVMLTASRIKVLSFLDKVFLLSLFGFVSVLFATGVFYAGFSVILKRDIFGFKFYLITTCILLLSDLFLYVFHLYISLRFGKGPSLGIGILESLISALLLTGLGKGVWLFFPCGWSGHFVNIWTYKASGLELIPAILHEQRLGIWICCFFTVFALLLACLWFQSWEGKKNN